MLARFRVNKLLKNKIGNNFFQKKYPALALSRRTYCEIKKPKDEDDKVSDDDQISKPVFSTEKYMDYLYHDSHNTPAWKFAQFCDQVIKGVGQLTFMESTVGGIGLLAGLAYFSPMTASSCLVGSILSIMWARFLKLDYDLIKCGAIAFNGVLVVAGAPFFLTPIEAVLFVSFFGPALAVYLFDRACKHLSFPVLTLPFVLTESLALLSTKFNIGVNPTFDFSSGPLPKFADLTQMDVLMTKIATAIPMSITQLCFTKDPSVTFGALFIGLLAYLDPKNALSAVSGATIGCIAGALLGYDFNNMLLMWGLNCALTSMALFPYFGKSYTTSVIGAVATAAIYPFFIYLSTKIGLLAFTAPFCVTTILMLKLKFLK